MNWICWAKVKHASHSDAWLTLCGDSSVITLTLGVCIPIDISDLSIVNFK